MQYTRILFLEKTRGRIKILDEVFFVFNILWENIPTASLSACFKNGKQMNNAKNTST